MARPSNTDIPSHCKPRLNWVLSLFLFLVKAELGRTQVPALILITLLMTAELKIVQAIGGMQ